MRKPLPLAGPFFVMENVAYHVDGTRLDLSYYEGGVPLNHKLIATTVPPSYFSTGPRCLLCFFSQLVLARSDLIS